MKNDELKSKKMVTVSQKELLSLVATSLRGKELFPRKVADAKKYLKDSKFTFPS